MKKLALLLLPLMIQAPAFAGHKHKTVHYEEHCYKNVERYTPGYYNEYGVYFRGKVLVERKRVPCRRVKNNRKVTPHFSNKKFHYQNRRTDNNSCLEGAILGGIGGAGLGAALSRDDGRFWAIPLGIVGGSLVGCQIDGG